MDPARPDLLAALLAPYLFGALAAVLAGGRPLGIWLAHLAAVAGGLVGTLVATGALRAGVPTFLGTFPLTPHAGLSFRLDALGAYFLLVCSLVVVAVSIYAIGYVRGDGRSPARLGLAYNGFLAALVLVLLADSIAAFLVVWEAMALASFLLVVHDHEHEETRRAGYVYLVMTHAGTAFLVVALLVLAGNAGSLEYGAIRAAAPALPAAIRDVVFLLVLIGFGTKAGLIPLHVWLPRAHPAAPSHVSALMSGLMIKTGVFGLLRVGWELAGPGPAWWGGLVIALGVVSAVLGVLYALTEHDLKRLLAYCSVENVGVIFVGVGAGLLLASEGRREAAALALAAGLLHVLNHALFKALLFLGAGAVHHATHTRDLEQLGGLIRFMPWTAGFFLLGSIAIAALPPLNGFASEWLTYQSLLALGSGTSRPVVAVGAAVAAALLALTGGLAVATFVKTFGVAFLGLPRRPLHARPREVDRTMLAGMGLLAAACVVLGLAPGLALGLLQPVTSDLVGATVAPGLSLRGLTATTATPGTLSPLLILAVLIALGGLGLAVGRLVGGPGHTRRSAVWVCGVDLEPRMQYTASALAQPFRLVFRTLVRPYRRLEHVLAQPPYFVAAVKYEAGVQPIYERFLYRRAVAAVVALSHQIRVLQNGSVRTYLAYIFVTLVVTLLLAR